MKSLRKYDLLGMVGSHVYSGPNIRIHVTEVSPRNKLEPCTVGFGELVINILEGSGTIKIGSSEVELSTGDQVLVEEGESFTMWSVQTEVPFITLMSWVPGSSAVA